MRVGLSRLRRWIRYVCFCSYLEFVAYAVLQILDSYIRPPIGSF